MVDKFRKIFFVFAIVAISLMGMPVHTAKAATVSAGTLIKASGAAVYYYASNGKRYVFPNEKTYKTWFNDFSSVVTITDAELAAIQIGGNIVYRPGTRLVKITTDPKVYAVSAHGTLHWITSETIANQLYGATWNQMIDDVSDAFFTNYTYGADITSAVHPNGAQIKYAGSSNIYVIEGGNKRLIADAAAYSANRFNSAYVMNIADTITYTSAATNLSAAESTYTDVAQLGGSTPVVVGNLNVAVASTTPASATVPQGAVGVSVAQFTLTAGSNAVTVDGLTLTRSGLGQATEIAKVYLYNGDAKLSSGRTINTSTNTVNFTNLGVTVPANGSVTLTVKVDIGVAGLGGTHRFGIAGVGDITSTASVGGVFPVNANEFAISSAVIVGLVDVESSGTASYTRKVGETNVELANMTVYVDGVENGKVESLTLYNSGRDIISNLKLYRGTTLVATGVQNGSYFTFNLATPYEIAKSESAQFTVKGDVSGREGDTATLNIRYKTDVRVKGMTYGYALNVAVGEGASPTDSYVEEVDATSQSNTITAEAGQLTAAFNGPVSSEVAKNTNDIVLMNFSLTAQAATDVEKTTIYVSGNGNLDAADIDDLQLVCNNVVVTEWSSVAVDATGVDDDGINGIDDAAEGLNASSDVWSLAAGGVNCQVRADILNTAAGTETIKATLKDLTVAGNWTFKDSATGDALVDIVPSGDIAGNEMTVTAATLDVVNASTPAAGITYVAGSSDDAINGFIFTAGAATAVKVTSIKLNAYLDDSNDTFDFAGANDFNHLSGVKNVVSAVRLYEDNAGVLTQIGTAKSLVVGTADVSVTFSDLNWTINAGASKKLLVKADISTTAPVCNTVLEAGVDTICGTGDDVAANTDRLAFAIEADANVVAEYGNGSALIANTLPNNTSATIYQTITTQGTLAVAVDAETPVSNLVAMGSTAQALKVKFSATNEDIKIEKLRIIDLMGIAGTAESVSVSYTNMAGSTATATANFSGANADFTGLDIKVPKDSSTIATFSVKYNTKTGGAVNGTSVQLELDNTPAAAFRAITLGSSKLIDTFAITTPIDGNEMFLYESFPTVKFSSSTPVGNFVSGINTLVAKIDITAGANQDVTFEAGLVGNYIDIALNASGAEFASNVKVTDGTDELCSPAAVDLTGGSGTYRCLFDSKDLVIGKGTTKTLYVYVDTLTAGLTASGEGVQASLLDDGFGTAIDWSINMNAANYNHSDIIFRGSPEGGALVRP